MKKICIKEQKKGQQLKILHVNAVKQVQTMAIKLSDII